MNIGLITSGTINRCTLVFIKKVLEDVISNSNVEILSRVLPLPKIVKPQSQYRSSSFLEIGQSVSNRFDKVLVLTDVDVFAPNFYFVFGEAEVGGRVASLSLFRLMSPNNADIFLRRCAKEAVHEVGHLYGLRHCVNDGCVMRFSKSVEDVDLKNCIPCKDCIESLQKLKR